jgi:CubicO group peptidase (beta-lactamase class C family)
MRWHMAGCSTARNLSEKADAVRSDGFRSGAGVAEDSDKIAFTRRAVIAGGVAALASGLQALGAEAKSLADIVASFDRERERRHVPSISVALVEAGGVSLLARGYRNAVRGQHARSDTPYQAASISKTVAAMTAIALTASGKVSLDADVATYLKRWKLPPIPGTSPRPVTLRRLFGMTAGCDVPGYLGYPLGAPLPTDIQILDGAPPANSPPVRIVTPPGTMRAYSGGGCQIGEVVMEDAAGQSFDALAGRLILRPLAMTRSGFFQPPDKSQHALFALAHDDAGRAIEGGWHVYPEYAAAGLWSTPAELATIVLAMIAAHKGDARTVLGTDGLAAMLTSVDDLGYGIGVALKGEGPQRIAMKRGNNLGFRSGLVACPASGQGAVVMTNGNGGEPIVDAVLDALAERYRWPGRAPWPE